MALWSNQYTRKVGYHVASVYYSYPVQDSTLSLISSPQGKHILNLTVNKLHQRNTNSHLFQDIKKPSFDNTVLIFQMTTTEGVSLTPFNFPPSLLFNVYLSYLLPKQELRLKLFKHLKQKQLPYQSTAYSVSFSCNFSAFPLYRAILWWTAQNSSSLLLCQHTAHGEGTRMRNNPCWSCSRKSLQFAIRKAAQPVRRRSDGNSGLVRCQVPVLLLNSLT